MGMFSTNRTSLGSEIDVAANESYVGAAGAYRAMCEGYENSYSIFEKCIELDFMEAAVVNEGASESEFEVIRESFVTDFFAKIKDFLLKLIEKVKGIVKSFIDRVVGTFTSDGKKLVSKYKEQILKKDLSKMKYKFAKPTGKSIDVKSGMDIYRSSNTHIFENCGKTLHTLETMQGNSDKENMHGMETEKELEDINEKINDNTYLEEALGATIGSSSSVEMGEFAKEAKDYMYEDEEKEDEGAGSLVSLLMETLTTAKKTVSDQKKEEKETIKGINEMLKTINNTQKEVINKKLPNKNEKADAKYKHINAYLNTASRLNSQLSTFVTKVFAVDIELHKFHFAQCKRLWVQMAAYNPKTVKEDVELIDAIGESAEYEAYESFAVAEMASL